RVSIGEIDAPRLDRLVDDGTSVGKEIVVVDQGISCRGNERPDGNSQAGRGSGRPALITGLVVLVAGAHPHTPLLVELQGVKSIRRLVLHDGIGVTVYFLVDRLGECMPWIVQALRIEQVGG